MRTGKSIQSKNPLLRRAQPSQPKTLSLIAAFAAAALVGPRLSRANFWIGSFSTNFNEFTNWADFAGVPGPNDAANFNSDTAPTFTGVSVNSNNTVKSVYMDAAFAVFTQSAYEFTSTNSAALTVSNGVFINSSSGRDNTLIKLNNFNLNAATLQIQAASGVPNYSFLLINGNSVVKVAGNTGLISKGTMTVGGAASFTTGGMTIGDASSGMLIDGSARVKSTSAINVNEGTLAVNSGTLDFTGNELVVDAGTVSFNQNYNNAGGMIRVITSGDINATGYLDIAGGPGGVARLNVSDSGSKLNIGTGGGRFSDWVNGGTSVATITFQNQSHGDYNSGLHIAAGSGVARVSLLSAGTVNVDNDLVAGGGGVAIINITGGGLYSSGTAIFAANATVALASGTLSLNDASFTTGSVVDWTNGVLNIASGKTLNLNGGTFTVTGGKALNAGATLRIANGGKFNSNSYFDIANGAATGTLIVDGAGSRITAAGSYTDWGLSPGNSATVTFSNSGAGTYNGLQLGASGGAARLTLNTGGTLYTGTLSTGNASATPSVTINLAGGTLTSAATTNFSKGSTVNLSSGGLALPSGGTFLSGATLNVSGGTINIPSNKTLTVDAGVGSFTSPYQFNNSATLRIVNGGGVLSTGSFDLAANLGGTLVVDGVGSRIVVANTSEWAASGSAVATFSNSGQGTFGTLNLNIRSGDTTINLLSSARLTTTASLVAGDDINTHVDLNIAGGMLNSAGNALFATGTTVALSSGSASFGGNTKFGPGATFNWSGGSWSTGSLTTVTFDGATANFSKTPSPGSNFNLSTGSTLRVTGGAKFNSNSGFSVPSGTLTVEGASTFTTGTQYTSACAFGTSVNDVATVTFSTFGVGSMNGGIELGSDGGAATLNLVTSGRLNAQSIYAGRASPGISPGAVVNINGGTLNVAGEATLYTGATINYTAGSFAVGTDLTTNNDSRILLANTGGTKVLRVAGLAMFGTSKIDLSNNAMIVEYTAASPISTVRGYVTTGRNGGAWTGNAITSSSAAASARTGLGVIEASDIGSPATFLGQSIDSTTVLIRYTLLGDANLSGTVTSTDFNQLVTNYGKINQGWYQGDVNYDGKIDTLDFASMIANFGVALPAELPGAEVVAAGALVPEPASIAFLSTLSMLVRRRR